SEVSLLPRGASELSHDCSCLDWPGPCRHVAALSYVLVEAVDEHPVHLLTLRGLTLDDLVQPQGGPMDGAAPGPVPGSAVGPDRACAAGGAAPSAGGPPFAPARMHPAQVAAVLGPETGAVIPSFYRAGTAPSVTAPSAADDVPP